MPAVPNDEDQGGFNWNDLGRVGAAAGVGMLPSLLFGGGSRQTSRDINSIIGELRAGSGDSMRRGSAYLDSSDDLIKQLTSYLTPLLSGDRNAALEAVQPEVRGVLDQYDTAIKNVTQFAPRGGGRTGALVDLEASRGQAVQDLLTGARRDAGDKAQTIAQMLSSMGLNLNQQGMSQLAQALAALTQKHGSEKESSSALGGSIGKILSGLLFGGA
ncbi:MAG: hypothetical protein AB7U20_07775 [Planctomycetaceae bacterium]